MKKLFSTILLLTLASVTNGQWVFESFDNAVGNLFPDTASTVLDSNYFSNGPTSYINLYNDADLHEGTGSMKMDYRVEAYDGWGGYNVVTTYGSDVDSLPYIDFSAGTEFSLWYKVLTPADTTLGGQVFTEFKIAEYDKDGNRELYYYQPDINYFDESGSWINVRMPLVQTDDKTTGFAPQFADGDGEIQWDKIKGFEVSVVYITAGNPSDPPSATGSILFDHWQLLGSRYTPIETFDNSASTFGIDNMGWNAVPGAVTLTDENVDFVEGAGALKMDYTLSAPEVWGGFVAIDKDVVVSDSMDERTALVLYMKNVTPVVADSGRAFIRVFVFENSTGADEEWIIDPDIDLSVASDWTRYYLPLTEKPMGVNDRFPAKDGFSLKNGAGDGVLNPEFIHKIRIEPFGRGTEDGFDGALLSDGTLLIDVMQTSGFKFTDVTPPAVPEGIAAVAGTNSNLITWTDVPGEDKESYNVYYSENPITDVNAEGVEVVQLGIEENVQVVEHVLLAPATDQEVTYYYAVNAVDKVGNVGAFGTTEAITNTAKGVTTIAMQAPAGFTADGDLSEWAGIKPFRIFPSDGSGTVKTGTTIDGDDDCSAEAYVAIENENLYVAFNINDDVVHHEETCDSWTSDSPDLLIGLYNWHGAPHTSYQHGMEPDYHFRFGKYLARSDHWENQKDSLLVNGTENYFWGEKFTGGYTVEAKIAFADLAAANDTIPEIKEGFRIPIDFVINDNDNNKPDGACWERREGILSYSSRNQDNGWQDVSVWSHTWYGDKWVVGVDDKGLTKNTYSLNQNYPNPFNPTTVISYSIAQPGDVSLKVFNILGQQVAQLVNKEQPAGSYKVNFNASQLSTGIYFYELKSGSFKQVKKMMLMK